jgi:8-oxo-dGTP diphosphatase
MDLAEVRFTLCFLTRGEEVLMLHRKRPPNQGLWNGVGGHIESGEKPGASCLREVREETGYSLDSLRFCGLLTWQGFEISSGGLFIFTAEAPAGEPVGNDEGELAWKPRQWVFSADAVVSNIHVFGPHVLSGDAPATYHFVYQNGAIQEYTCGPLPHWCDPDNI